MVEENRIFVGGLSQATSEESLLGYFQQYGAIESKVFMDKDTGRSKGYGFVTFQEGGLTGSDAVQEALSITHTIDGKTVDCKVSVQKGLAPPPQNASIVNPQRHAGGGHSQYQWQPSPVHTVGAGLPVKTPASGSAPTQHKLFVGGLSQSTTRENMQEYFSTFGLCECVVMMDKETGRSRGFGFCTFQSEESVHATLSVQGHELDGKQIECKACEEASNSKQMAQMGPMGQQYSQYPQYPAAASVQATPQNYEATRIFVGGLPQTCDSNGLGEVFSQFGTVTEAKVHMDPTTNRSKGFGYVSFDSPHAVELAVASSHALDIGGKWVEVKRSEARGKSSGKAASFHPPAAPMLDLGIPVAPGSPAARAAQYLGPQQAWEIRGMSHLLQDPTCCAVIRALCDQVFQSGAGPRVVQPMVFKGKGGARRFSPY